MLHSAALPFVLRREHDVVSGLSVTSTREELHGLLRLDGEQLLVQWRTTREISRVGHEIRTDRELAPIREVSIPLSGLASARVRRAWRRWRRKEVLVLTAADLRAFDVLTGEAGAPGLVLEHPAELVLELRRSDGVLAREFASELSLAVSEAILRSVEEESQESLLAGERGESLDIPEAEESSVPLRSSSRRPDRV